MFGAAVVLVCGLAVPVLSADDALLDDALLRAEQDAFQKAALSVSPSLVTIETIGGFDKLGEVRLNTGATTGTVIGRDGWIISSAFNLAGQPQAIFVTLEDGRRVAAQRVATDEVRKLVLLKADASGLAPIMSAPPEAAVVGRWGIAVGKTYGASPNLSVGVVSALGRIGGLAIQTDAKVSPVNYGGPLLDVQGRALGLLVPMSPKTTSGGDELAGIEWYDSGIGFAVPMADVIESARRLRDGDDLLPGKLGVSFVGSGLLDEPATIKAIHPLGPADVAGLKPGDVIESINDEAVSGLRVLKLKLAGLYAGEAASLTALRGEEALSVSLELAAELPAYEFPWLGLVVDVGEGGTPVVRTVTGGGPADGVLKTGDVLQSVDGVEIKSALQAQSALQLRRTDEPMSVTIARGDEVVDLELTPTSLPSDLPEELAAAEFGDAEANDDLVGRWTGEVLDGQINFWAYTPPAASTGAHAGLLVWLADGGNALLPAVRAECHARNVALLVPSPAGDDWTAGDVAGVEAAVGAVAAKLTLDPRRVALVTSGTGAVLGLTLAEKEDSVFYGLVLQDPKLQSPPRPVSPEHRLIWGVVGEEGTKAEAIAKFLERARHPVTLLPDPFESGDALIRWVDWLGRM